MIFNTRL